ncbi:MAG: UMP kinase [Candidatus Thermoplasmatota archaeon]
MDKVVVSVGGSILLPEERAAERIREIAMLLKDSVRAVELFVVVGGGGTARYYINMGRALGCSEALLDEMGIAITRVNAMLLAAALGESAPIPHTIEEALEAKEHHGIVVMGGTVPGHTTDAVSALLAERSGAARFVNATAVDGVYSADPAQDPDARRYDRMSFAELAEVCGRSLHKAGPHVVLDPEAVRILSGARIPTIVVHGGDMGSLRGAILGRGFRGTVIE